jgi:hypothetical protein
MKELFGHEQKLIEQIKSLTIDTPQALLSNSLPTLSGNSLASYVYQRSS